MVTRINVHTEDPQIFSATVQNIRPDDLMHPNEQYWNFMSRPQHSFLLYFLI